MTMTKAKTKSMISMTTWYILQTEHPVLIADIEYEQLNMTMSKSMISMPMSKHSHDHEHLINGPCWASSYNCWLSLVVSCKSWYVVVRVFFLSGKLQKITKFQCCLHFHHSYGHGQKYSSSPIKCFTRSAFQCHSHFLSQHCIGCRGFPIVFNIAGMVKEWSPNLLPCIEVDCVKVHVVRCSSESQTRGWVEKLTGKVCAIVVTVDPPGNGKQFHSFYLFYLSRLIER